MNITNYKDLNQTDLLSGSPLGKTQTYHQKYNPDILFSIPRSPKRKELNVINPLPFKGFDMWRAYEFSWLDTLGKLNLAILELFVPCDSEFIIESKSLKLYLYTYSNSKFESWDILELQVKRDLCAKTNSEVIIRKLALEQIAELGYSALDGICIDDLPINTYEFQDFPPLLTSNTIVSEIFHSHLLQSNCPVTKQPDWGSVEISYTGFKINCAKLVEFIGSFRYQNEFHEQCIEKIFMTILTHCKPSLLTVKGFYTRRGGIDINPFRSTDSIDIPQSHIRLIRQ